MEFIAFVAGIALGTSVGIVVGFWVLGALAGWGDDMQD